MAATPTRVRREGEYAYVNKYLEKELSFTPAGDEMVATFGADDTADAADTLSLLDAANIEVLNPDQGFAVIRLGDTASAMDLADTLEGNAVIGNALPVMLDDEQNRRYFLPDQLTVQFANSVASDQAEAIIEAQGSQIVTEQRTPGYYTITVPEGEGLFETLRTFSEMDEVLFAEPAEAGIDDLLVDMQDRADEVLMTDVIDLRDLDAEELAEATSDTEAFPTDALFADLWGLHNTGQAINGTSGTPDADIDAPLAWNITKGSSKVVVAVIDTGCDLDHPDLQPRMYPRGSEDWDFADPADDVPWDSGSHGTHVAGTAVGSENHVGVIGVAPGARLMPLRVNLISGMNANRADAINYVAAQAAAHPGLRYVINCSWRMSGDHAGVKMAIQNAIANNVVVVFAAGNAGRNIDVNPQYPAVYPEVMAVAATDQNDRRANPGFWSSNYGTKVDVSAPGVNVMSSVPDDAYGLKDGTSMASPHVAGLAALIWSRNLDLTNAEVRNIIESTTDNIDALNPGFAGKLGTGRINAYRALLATPAPTLATRLVRRYEYPQPNAGSSTGLAFLPRFRVRWFGYRPLLAFLTQQAGSERVYFLDSFSGTVRHSVDPVANDTIGSLAWDGTHLLVANVTVGAGSINRINPYSGSQVGSIPAPPGRGEGLAFDGRSLYYSTIARINVMNPMTGTVTRSFPAPGGNSRGLTYGKGWLFSANTATGEITVFNPRTGFVHGTIQAPGGGTQRAEAIAFDARRRELYVANQSEETIYVMRVGL